MYFTESNFKSQLRSILDISAGYAATTGLLKSEGEWAIV